MIPMLPDPWPALVGLAIACGLSYWLGRQAERAEQEQRQEFAARRRQSRV